MKNYQFDGSISLDVLNNYLDRAVTYCGFLNNRPNIFNDAFVDEAIRFITNVGAKYIQRAAGEWYPSYDFEKYYSACYEKLAKAHKIDPDIIFEACIFEVSSIDMNNIPIPTWVFKAFGFVPQKRNFNVDLTLFQDGYGVDYWEKNYHIPDITTMEMQMFVYYRACCFIDIGFEALHLGQVKLTGKNDINYVIYTRIIGMIRDYAKNHARRGYVIINAHDNYFKAPSGNMLADMIVAPTRVHAAKDEVNHVVSETNPQRCDIEPGYWGDSIYCSGISGISPSGWYAEKYPYLVEFDNYGGIMGDISDKDCYVWGRDEIAWYTAQPTWYRRKFIRFLVDKINAYNENGHLSLVGFRGRNFFANNKSKWCPNGSGDEEMIKEIFSE